VKLLLLALAFVSPAFAAATDAPEREAVQFVEKLRDKKIDLAPGRDTALSPATGEDKRKLIEERITRMAGDLGSGDLEAGPGKVDGDMAAVLVRQAAGFDPSRLRVIAVGLIRKDNRWQPAPVPGSFENTGLGYDAEISKRLAALEAWMMREQVLDLTALRETTAERLRKAISARLKPDDLHEATPAQLMKRLIDACVKRDQATVLGLIGGLETELPKDWSSRVAAVDEGLSATPKNSPWRLLSSPGVIRTVALSDSQASDHEAKLDLVFLDATSGTTKPSGPRIKTLAFAFSKNDQGLWRIDLPEVFLSTPEDNGNEAEDESAIDSTVLEALPAALRRDYPATPFGTAREALDAMIKSLRGDAPSSLLPLLDLEGESTSARLGVMRMAMTWQDLHQSDARTPLLLGFQELGEGAAAAFQLFSAKEPDRLDLRVFYFSKLKSGWLLTSGLRPADPPPEPMRAIKGWVNEHSPEWSKNWESLALSSSPELEAIPAGEPPSEADAKATFERWCAAIKQGDPTAAMACTAHLKVDRGPARLLRNLGYEFIGAQKSKLSATLLGIIRKGSWCAVSARIGKAGDAAATYPLYPLVNTPQGPRILAEIDLFANGTRTRDYLNEAIWGRLNSIGAGEASATLREIYEAHRKNAVADRPSTPAP
jgi:hypothetical protein